jgi:hypothetical protein
VPRASPSAVSRPPEAPINAETPLSDDLQAIRRIELNRHGRAWFSGNSNSGATRDWTCELIATDEDSGHPEAGAVVTIDNLNHYRDCWRGSAST